MKRQSSQGKDFGYFFSLSQIGFEMVMPAGLGALVDYYWNTSPWGVVIGAILGFPAGMIHLFSMVARHEKERRQKHNETQD